MDRTKNRPLPAGRMNPRVALWFGVALSAIAIPILAIGANALTALLAVSANLLYVLWDPLWLRALGDLVTTSVGVVAMVRIWQVWPIDFAAGSAWDVVARILVGIGIAGGLIGIVASVGRFTRALAAPPGRTS
jgi:4-hydroxybenzoate polyprenyltransferase